MNLITYVSSLPSITFSQLSTYKTIHIDSTITSSSNIPRYNLYLYSIGTYRYISDGSNDLVVHNSRECQTNENVYVYSIR